MVSIIVPVYNTEKYLAECIESVLNQEDPDWELLLIDDGSAIVPNPDPPDLIRSRCIPPDTFPCYKPAR